MIGIYTAVLIVAGMHGGILSVPMKDMKVCEVAAKQLKSERYVEGYCVDTFGPQSE